MESDYVDGKGWRGVGLGTKTIAVFPRLGIHGVAPYEESPFPSSVQLEHPRNRSFNSRNQTLVEIDYREKTREGYI